MCVEQRADPNVDVSCASKNDWQCFREERGIQERDATDLTGTGQIAEE